MNITRGENIAALPLSNLTMNISLWLHSDYTGHYQDKRDRMPWCMALFVCACRTLPPLWDTLTRLWTASTHLSRGVQLYCGNCLVPTIVQHLLALCHDNENLLPLDMSISFPSPLVVIILSIPSYILIVLYIFNFFIVNCIVYFNTLVMYFRFVYNNLCITRKNSLINQWFCLVRLIFQDNFAFIGINNDLSLMWTEQK